MNFVNLYGRDWNDSHSAKLFSASLAVHVRFILIEESVIHKVNFEHTPECCTA